MKSMGKEPENILEKVWDLSESGRYWTRTQIYSYGSRKEEISLLQVRGWDTNHYEGKCNFDVCPCFGK